MTVLDVVKLASTVIGITTPSALFASTDATSVQLKNCLNETAQMIAYDAEHDWTKLKTLATITGDGVATAFDLPVDYDRMLKKARLWPSAMPNTPLVHYPDTDTWLGMLVQNFRSVVGRWTIIGTQINIQPVVPLSATVQYFYLTNLIVQDQSGTGKTSFGADSDTFPLGERLLKIGFIYRWKQDRGQEYGEAMEDYQTALASHIGKDKGSNILVVGDERVPASVNFAFPGVLGQ